MSCCFKQRELFLFEFVEGVEGAVGVEGGERELFGEAGGFVEIEVGFGGASTSKDGEAGAEGDDFAACATFGGVGPSGGSFLEVEEDGEDLLHVFPIGGMIGLEIELPPLFEGAADKHEERGGDETLGDFLGGVIGLGVVAVDFSDGCGRDVAFEEFASPRDAETDIGEAALVGAAGGVADDKGEDVDAEMVVLLAPEGAANEEASVAAAEVDDDGSGSAEEFIPVEMGFGELFESGLSPAGFVEDVSWERDAEFAFALGAVRVRHGGIDNGELRVDNWCEYQ